MEEIMSERMPLIMAIIQERLPNMRTRFEGQLLEMVQKIQEIFMGTGESGRFLGNQQNFSDHEERLLQLLAVIEGRIPETLGALEEWRNNTEMSIAEKIPVLIVSLNENITRVEEAVGERLPGLMQILEEKLPRLLNSVQSKLPEILDIIEQKLPQLLNETQAALPDLLDNIEEGIAGVLDSIDGRLPPVLDILREGLPLILESLEESIPGILDVVEARMEGLLDTFDTTLPQVLDVVSAKVVNVLDLLEANAGELLGIVAENLPQLLGSLETALPTILDEASAILPELLSTVIQELPGFFDSFRENLTWLENTFRTEILSFLEEWISTCFTAIEEVLPSAVEYVTTIVAESQNSTADLLDMIEGTLLQAPGTVDEQMTEMLNYYQHYFPYFAKQALPCLFGSLAALLDINGAGGVTYAPEFPGQGIWNCSIPDPESLMEITRQALGDISVPGKRLLGLFQSKRQGDLPSLELGPTCPGEGDETENCGMTACPI